MNADVFDSAYQLLTDHGFKNIYGNRPVEAPTGRSAALISPSGRSISISEHIRKEG